MTCGTHAMHTPLGDIIKYRIAIANIFQEKIEEHLIDFKLYRQYLP